MKSARPKLPQLLDRKLYKTGQTRGADDDVIFQNRVARNSTVLIPYKFWNSTFVYPKGEESFENGYIVLIPPNEYFENKNKETEFKKKSLKLGKNCLVFYETRREWDRYNPEKEGWKPAQSRTSPLGGEYVARVPATTATKGGEKVIRGFTTTDQKGAGIRLYEYASKSTIKKCRLQLEGIYWLCFDSIEAVCANKLTKKEAIVRKNFILEQCDKEKLLDLRLLEKARTIDNKKHTICPLCLERLSGKGFLTKMTQAEGREVPDITVTEINLFHIDELRYGAYNHRPYNVGWGHYHCNVVTRDTGVEKTIHWMMNILQRNKEKGFIK